MLDSAHKCAPSSVRKTHSAPSATLEIMRKKTLLFFVVTATCLFTKLVMELMSYLKETGSAITALSLDSDQAFVCLATCVARREEP